MCKDRPPANDCLEQTCIACAPAGGGAPPGLLHCICSRCDPCSTATNHNTSRHIRAKRSLHDSSPEQTFVSVAKQANTPGCLLHLVRLDTSIQSVQAQHNNNTTTETPTATTKATPTKQTSLPAASSHLLSSPQEVAQTPCGAHRLLARTRSWHLRMLPNCGPPQYCCLVHAGVTFKNQSVTCKTGQRTSSQQRQSQRTHG